MVEVIQGENTILYQLHYSTEAADRPATVRQTAAAAGAANRRRVIIMTSSSSAEQFHFHPINAG